jgi:hypothetical protein
MTRLRDAISRARIRSAGRSSPAWRNCRRRIVGVVADVRGQTLNNPPAAEYFLPALQRPENFTNILVRTNVSPAAMTPMVREALRAIDPDLPLLQPQALTTRIARTVADRKLALRLLEAFAGARTGHRHARRL